MSTPLQFKQLCAPLAVMFHRMNRDSANGKPLAGLNVRPLVLDYNAIGNDDLPLICPIDHVSKEQIFSGGKARPKDTQSVNLQDTPQMVFLLCVNRENGFMQLDTSEPLGIMDWFNLICDTLNRSDTGEQDGTLDGTCNQPFMIRGDNMNGTGLSVATLLTVDYFPHGFERGTRCDAMNVPYSAE